MAGFIYAKQQASTPTEAAAGFRPTMAGGGNGFPSAPQHARHFAIPEQGVRGWSFAQQDPNPFVPHVHAAGTCASRGLPAQARHKNEEKQVLFIPGISNSRPSYQVPPEEQWKSKPTSSSPPVGFIREALQLPKIAEMKEKACQKKEKACQKVASLIGGK